MKEKLLVIKCFFLNLRNRNRFRWICPDCKKGKNVRKYGGNKKCFHCSDCPFIECALLFFKP